MHHPAPVNPMTAYQTSYIYSPEGVANMVEFLANADELALDVEFDRERFSYGTTICLIQVFANEHCFLVDPMQGPAPEALYRLFENPAIQKIMHAPGEDLQVLHLQKCFPLNVFDTERTARLLNYESFSLAALLKETNGISLNKAIQKTNWTQRPLSEWQIQYAGEDVISLPGLRNTLIKQVHEKNIDKWVNEENKAWDTYRAIEKPPGVYTHRDDEKKYSQFDLFRLNELLAFRDHFARKLNKPGYMVLVRELIDQMIAEPTILRQWNTLKGIHPSLRNDHCMNELQNRLRRATEKAEKLNLSKTHPAKKRRDAGSYPQISLEQRQINEEILLAIKAEIALRWGTHTAAYILSQKAIREMAAGTMNLADLPFAYRQTLIREIAAELKPGFLLP